MNTASTSRRTRRSSAVSRRCWSTSRRSKSTIAILRGLQEKYEVHHGVEITDPAIVAAAELSHRYITDRFLPDKAIDLIDEAAARIKMEIDSKPEEMDKLERRLIQLKIEREAVKKEKDEGFAQAPWTDRGGDRAPGERVCGPGRNLEGRESTGAGLTAHQGRTGEAQARDGCGQAQGRLAESLRAAVRPHAPARGTNQEGGNRQRNPAAAQAAAHAGRRGGNRRGGLACDRHPGVENDAGRAREAVADGAEAARAGGRPG